MSNPYDRTDPTRRDAWDDGYGAAQAERDSLKDEMTHLRADAEYAQVKQVAAEAERDALKLELDTARAEGHWAGMLRAAEIAEGGRFLHDKAPVRGHRGRLALWAGDIAAAIRAAARAATDAECAK